MNITKAQYTTDFDGNNSAIKATINGKELIVPIAPDNTDYTAIQKWAEEDGNEIQAAD